MYLWIVLGLLIFSIVLTLQREPFENIKEDIGNYLSSYFHRYATSICNQEDFVHPPHTDVLLKDLPEHIPFQPDLAKAFQEKGITLERLRSVFHISLWECREPWILDLWFLLKPTVQSILQKAIDQSGLQADSRIIVHFRCADTPFIRHISYYLQRYAFFKECLQGVPPQKIVLMNCSTHRSGKEDQEACSRYVDKLSEYIRSLGYTVETQCKTNGQDFADLFQAKRVISTGGSFSFMSGFFGKGEFFSTDHGNSPEGIFKKGYNIPHEQVESYHDTDHVYTLLQS
jgi:hypothetical protein